MDGCSETDSYHGIFNLYDECKEGILFSLSLIYSPRFKAHIFKLSNFYNFELCITLDINNPTNALDCEKSIWCKKKNPKNIVR